MASTPQLCTHLFGSPVASELVSDALREIANCVAGAVKRAALAENLAFAMSLPAMGASFGPGDGRRVWGFRFPGVTLSVRCLAVEVRARFIPVNQLRERMVIAQDIKAPTGLLIVSTGTMLTACAVGRIQDVMDNGDLVRAVVSSTSAPGLPPGQ
ncbi:MAG: hypothetical protein EXR76_03850 [Myxococcales bacterium]|nr:hypothetical protein [Myxococcales bacterium]